MEKSNGENRIRIYPATEERQFLMDEPYEVYVKEGSPTGAMGFHHHNFFEVLYVMEGEYISVVEEQTYFLHKGDFLLVDQNVMHRYQPREVGTENSKRIILWVTAAFLKEISGGLTELTECFRHPEARAWHFPVYYEELLRGYLMRLALEGPADSMRRIFDRGYLLLFFAQLNLLCGRKESLLAGKYVEQHPLTAQVNSYVEAHIGDAITVDCLAEYVHMSKYHFLHKFKEITGMTVHAYVMNKRLIRACELLQDGAGIAQAYQSTGFSDYSVFLRNFKATFGVPPGRFRV